MAIAGKEQKSSEHLEKISALNIEAKKLDDSRLMIATDFCEDLKGTLLDIMAHEENDSNGGHVSRDVIKAEYQADCVMAQRFRSEECDLILLTDMDFSAIAGPNCICIKNIKTITEKVTAGERERKTKKAEAPSVSFVFDVGAGSNTRMDDLKTHLEKKVKTTKIVWKKAAYPILDNSSNYLRSLFVVGIGCDVFPGINYITPRLIGEEWKK